MKTYRFLIVMLVIIIVLPFAGRLFWIMKKSKTIDLVLINKSVENSANNELKTLNWALNFDKYVDSLGYSYSYKTDYYGHYPDALDDNRKIKSYKLEEISSLAKNFDALIFLDNKGVELARNSKKTTKNSVYGGLNQNDYFLLKEMLNYQKLVIAEFNFFSSPTEDLVRYNTEQLLDIYSLGWNGKYYENLAKEEINEPVSASLFDLYRQNYSADWDFSGPGIILLNLGQKRIIVLPAEKYMNSDFPTVETTTEIAALYHLPEKAAFTGWFDISYQGKNKVVSTFNLNLNNEGIDILRNNGIESIFPAVIKSENYRFFYIAGDFSKGTVLLSLSKLGFISNIVKKMGKGKSKNPDKFNQAYYNFLLSAILNSYYSDINASNN